MGCGIWEAKHARIQDDVGLLDHSYTGTVSVSVVKARKIVERQAVKEADRPDMARDDGVGSDKSGKIEEEETPELNILHE